MHHSWRRLILCALAFAVAAAPLACGSKEQRESTEPVKGRVLLGSEPLTSGTVVFHPEGAEADAPPRLQAMGMIRPDGTYELMSGAQPGAVPGRYRAVIVVMPAPGGPGAKTRVPPKYTDPKTTDLVVEVVEEPRDNQYELRLKK